MTIEEITRTLETVAGSQTHTTQPKAELEATVQEIAQFHQHRKSESMDTMTCTGIQMHV